MTSLNPKLNALHESFLAATRYEDLPMNMATERYWYEADKSGVTPAMVLDVVRWRQKRIEAGVRHPESLRLKNLVGDDEKIAELLEEAAMLSAQRRVRRYSPAKVEVLKATGRPSDPPPRDAVSTKPIFDAIRKAIDEQR